MSLHAHRTVRLGFLAALGLIAGSTASAQVLVGPGGNIAPGPTLTGAGTVQHAEVRTAQRLGTSAARKPLPRQIVATPDVEEELEVIERRSQLMITRSGVVRTAIADSSVIEVVQYSEKEIAVIGLTRGATTLTLWFEDSDDPLIYLVTVIPDPSIEEQREIDYGKLERKIAELFPNSKVHLVPLSRKIVVLGQARDGEEAARIIEIVRGEYINQYGGLYGPQGRGGAGAGTGNGLYDDLVNGNGNGNGLYSSFIVNMLEVPGEFQVQLRVRIAELNRQQLRRMGVDWNVIFGNGRHALGAALGGAAGTFTGVLEAGEINVLIDWLASNGTVKILSEPVMTVLSGHNASFLSGGEFAVPTIVGIGGAAGQQTTFRGFGTSLVATPTVIDRDLVRLRITPEFSQINQANSSGGVPGVDTRRIQTTVEMREGQTLALAGLIARQTNTEVTRIPFLGEIPWIGPAIFNAKRSTEDETELLILVTPEIVRPMEADEVPPVPGFNVTHPSDCELYWHARTEGAPDVQYYQLAPFGRGAGHGIPVGYKLFAPAPASPSYPPQPTRAYTGDPRFPVSPGGGRISTPSRYPGHATPIHPGAAPRGHYPGSGPAHPGTLPRQIHPGPIPSAPPRDAIAPPRTEPLVPTPGTIPRLPGPTARRPGIPRSAAVTPTYPRTSSRTGRVSPAEYQSNQQYRNDVTRRTPQGRFTR